MELVDSLLDADRFTSLDMRNGYNNLRVREGDEAKLAFTCKAGQFEPLTMPFGPTGAPGFFQFFIQDILKAHIGRDVAAYQDDIVIYTKPGVDHEKVVKEVLKILQKQNVWLRPEKCKFSQKEVAYLGLIISKNQIKMDETKVKPVKEWPPPKNLSEVLTFLGFSNFYRRFIHQFSKIARPLHELSKDNVKLEWTKERNDAFESLKKAFTTAPILTIANPYKPFILECDCSDFALGAVLSQVSEEDNELHPVAYLSRSLIKAERNYEVFDKELLAVISAFKEWRHYLEGNPHRLNVIVYTDHKNLESLMTTKELTRRQARWAEILGSFDFEIRFRPGKQSTKPDALSRRPDLKPEAGDKLSFGRLLKEENLPSDAFIDCLDGIEEWFEKESVMNCEIEAFIGPEEMWTDDAIIDEIRTKSAEDVKINEMIKLCQEMPNIRHDEVYSVTDDVLYYKGKIVVPDDNNIKLKILRSCHDSKLAGHPGRMRTLMLVKRHFHWNSMKTYINKYVDGCQSCQRVNARTNKPFGSLQPLPIPQGPWIDICYDMITVLPESDGYDSISTVVDRFSKMAHFIPCQKTMSSEELAKLMLRNVWKIHGTPRTITSDRGNIFISKLTKEMNAFLGIRTQSSTAYHPQTDGQSEITNKSVEQYLRHFVSYKQDDWNDLLPIAEFSYNNNFHVSIGMSLFKANYGFDISFTGTPSKEQCLPATEERIRLIKEVQDELRIAMEEAQRSMKEQFDRKVQETPNWKSGEEVWLNSRHITTTRPTAKFSHRWLGPYKIVEKISTNAYKLLLPVKMKNVHPVFHVNLLRKFSKSEIKGQTEDELPPIEIEGREEFEVEEVLNKRKLRKKTEYLVSWKGYGPNHDSWEPEENLSNAKEMVKDFNDKYPQAERRYFRTQRR